jgi:ABC-type multidrug transport system fused ATPase/permease subunit
MNQVLLSLKRLWPLVRPYKKKLVAVFFFGLIISLCNVAQTALVKTLFSEVFRKTKFDYPGFRFRNFRLAPALRVSCAIPCLGCRSVRSLHDFNYDQ